MGISVPISHWKVIWHKVELIDILENAFQYLHSIMLDHTMCMQENICIIMKVFRYISFETMLFIQYIDLQTTRKMGMIKQRRSTMLINTFFRRQDSYWCESSLSPSWRWFSVLILSHITLISPNYFQMYFNDKYEDPQSKFLNSYLLIFPLKVKFCQTSKIKSYNYSNISYQVYVNLKYL